MVEQTEFFERHRFVYNDYEREFLSSFSSDQMIELLNAANHLDIPFLFLYGCQRAAEMMEGKTYEEVLNDWNLPVDLSEAEKALKRRHGGLVSGASEYGEEKVNPDAGK